jgi:ribosome-associated translation inhibitor RaiA
LVAVPTSLQPLELIVMEDIKHQIMLKMTKFQDWAHQVHQVLQATLRTSQQLILMQVITRILTSSRILLARVQAQEHHQAILELVDMIILLKAIQMYPLHMGLLTSQQRIMGQAIT